MSLSEKLRRKGGGEVGNPGESVVSKKGQSSDGERHQIKQGCSGGGVFGEPLFFERKGTEARLECTGEEQMSKGRTRVWTNL